MNKFQFYDITGSGLIAADPLFVFFQQFKTPD